MTEIVTAWKDSFNHAAGRITHCTKCNKPLERRSGMFFWRGDYSDGAVCPDGHGLWSVVGEEMAPLKPTTNT